MTDSTAWRPRLADLAGFLAAATVGLFAFFQSHQKWLDPIIDIGRDLYIPEHLARGALLYRDFTYNYPPLGPYLLAGVVRIAGSSLAVYQAIGLGIAFLTAAALYWICAVVAGRLAAALAAVLFFATSFSSEPGYNYLFPYSHALILGVMFALIQLAALLHYLQVRRHFALLLMSLFAGVLASWCRIEMAAVAVAVVLIATLVEKAPWVYAWGYALTLGIAAWLVHLYFSGPGVSPWGQMFPQSLLLAQRARAFHRIVAGLSDWRQNLLEAFWGLVLILGVALLIRLVPRRTAVGRRPMADPSSEIPEERSAIGRRPTWQKHYGRTVALVGVFAALFFLQPDIFFRGWLLLILLLVPIVFWQRGTLLLLLSVAVLSGMRIWLNLHPGGYGFALTVLLLPLIVYVLFVLMPRLTIYRTEDTIFWVPVLLAVAVSSLYAQNERYSRSRYPVQSSRGRFFDWNAARAPILNEFLSGEFENTQSMVVLPEGLTLNYFTGVDTPLRRYLFLPPETADPAVEKEILEEWSQRPPRKVVLVTRPLDEYGSAGFGVDYNRELRTLLDREYVIERRWDNAGFALVLLQKRKSPAADASVDLSGTGSGGAELP